MRYNPCGRVVAFLRNGYTTNCRFWTNSEVEEEIRWYVTDPAAPVLGYPSKIRPLGTCYIPEAAAGVGEVYPQNYQYYWAPPIPFQNWEHVCGSREDFEVGGVRDDTPPPVEYDRHGIPVCCQPPIVADGGGVGTGTADVSVVGLVYCPKYFSNIPFAWFLNPTIPDQKWESDPLTTLYTVLTSPLYPGNTDWVLLMNNGPFGATNTYEPNPPGWDGHGDHNFDRVGGAGAPLVVISCVPS